MTTKQKKRIYIFCLLAVILLTALSSGCGQNPLLVGTWDMSKVLVGDKEYDAATFLDPTNKTVGSFVIQFYGDQTLIATGSLGTIKGASDGKWEKISDQKYAITIDGQKREVKMVGDLLFMDIAMKDGSVVVVFERETK